MLTTPLIHPDLVGLLAACGHGDKVLIADGNYPLDSRTGIATEKVYLGLTPGIPTVTQVLDVLAKSVKIESVEVMVPSEGPEPEIFGEFREILPEGTEFKNYGRFQFYELCQEDDVKVAISTGEQRIYANILITVGV